MVTAISYAFLPVMEKSLHAVLLKICTEVTHCFTAAVITLLLGKRCPHSPSFISLSGWKSGAAKSRLYCGCCKCSQDWLCAPRSSSQYVTWHYCVAKCLLWPNATSMSLLLNQYCNVMVRLMVVHGSRKSRRIIPFLS